MTTRTAACSCGQLTARVAGDPVRVSICHCFACQRRTGSVFGAQARFAAAKAEFDGESSEFVRVADSGNRIRFRFCPHCGATVWYAMDTEPELVAIPVGAFADPSFPPPGYSVYEECMHSWVVTPSGLKPL